MKHTDIRLSAAVKLNFLEGLPKHRPTVTTGKLFLTDWKNITDYLHGQNANITNFFTESQSLYKPYQTKTSLSVTYYLKARIK